MTTWYELIGEEMMRQDESPAFVCDHVPDDPDWLYEEFEQKGTDGPNGQPFTLWTTNRVYFPICHNRWASVRSVARQPDGNITPYIGLGKL